MKTLGGIVGWVVGVIALLTGLGLCLMFALIAAPVGVLAGVTCLLFAALAIPPIRRRIPGLRSGWVTGAAMGATVVVGVIALGASTGNPERDAQDKDAPARHAQYDKVFTAYLRDTTEISAKRLDLSQGNRPRLYTCIDDTARTISRIKYESVLEKYKQTEAKEYAEHGELLVDPLKRALEASADLNVALKSFDESKPFEYDPTSAPETLVYFAYSCSNAPRTGIRGVLQNELFQPLLK